MNDYPWDQLSLLPPPALSITFRVFVEGTSDTITIGATTREHPSGELVGIDSTGFPATTSGEQDLVKYLVRYILGLRDRTSPFG